MKGFPQRSPSGAQRSPLASGSGISSSSPSASSSSSPNHHFSFTGALMTGARQLPYSPISSPRSPSSNGASREYPNGFDQVLETPITLRDLEARIRSYGLSDEGRQRWWPQLPIICKNERLKSSDPAIDRWHSMFATPHMVEKRYREAVHLTMSKCAGTSSHLATSLFSADINKPGMDKVGEIVALLISANVLKLEDLPFVAPLLYRVCTILPRADQVHSLVHKMYHEPEQEGNQIQSQCYVNVNIQEYRATLSVFRAVLRKLLPKQVAILNAIDACCDFYLHRIFVGLFSDVVEEKIATKILDCYLLEGETCLLRFGYALLAYFSTEITAERFQSGDEFWTFVFHASHQINFEELSATAYETGQTKNGKLFSRFTKPTPSGYFAKATVRSLKTEAAKLLQEFSETEYEAYMTGVCTRSVTTTKFDYSMMLQSLILSTPAAINLSTYMRQVRATPSSFRLAYRSAFDGCRLRKLLESTGLSWPCILLLRASKTGATFGAYLNCPLSPPDNTIRGDRGCFLFRLDGINANRYFAVGLQVRCVTYRLPLFDIFCCRVCILCE
jgi:hypothetical protein